MKVCLRWGSSVSSSPRAEVSLSQTLKRSCSWSSSLARLHLSWLESLNWSSGPGLYCLQTMVSKIHPDSKNFVIVWISQIYLAQLCKCLRFFVVFLHVITWGLTPWTSELGYLVHSITPAGFTFMRWQELQHITPGTIRWCSLNEITEDLKRYK